MDRPNYIVISPVRDEARYIEKTIQSMARQTCLPLKWIVVNDGSTDRTPEILDSFAEKYPWMTIVHRDNRGFRKSGGGVIEAFYDGYEIIEKEPWEFLIKLDGDLSFDSDYFEKCFSRFKQDPKLGIGGGTVCVVVDGQIKIDSIGDPPFHVRGATKIYRRYCWEHIERLVQAPGWDTIDEVQANMYGWTTRTFDHLKLIQHKPTGSEDGSWGNWVKNGFANYTTGYHPLFMLSKCVKRAMQKPYLLVSVALAVGYCSGYMKRRPRVIESEVIDYLRQQQLRRMTLRPSIYCSSDKE